MELDASSPPSAQVVGLKHALSSVSDVCVFVPSMSANAAGLVNYEYFPFPMAALKMDDFHG